MWTRRGAVRADECAAVAVVAVKAKTLVKVTVTVEVFGSDGCVKCELAQEEYMRSNPQALVTRLRKAAEYAAMNGLCGLRSGRERLSGQLESFREWGAEARRELRELKARK